jgi:hypothetical protein
MVPDNRANPMAMTKFGPVQPADQAPAQPKRFPTSRPAKAVEELPMDAPRFGDVMSEIGLLLAIHLAVAFAVALTLRLCGIA